MFTIEDGRDSMATEGPRTNWPWKDMAVGNLVKIGDDMGVDRKYAQINCHVYGNSAGKAFRTRTIDGVLHVWRIA